MADLAVLGILMAAMAFIMWVGHRVARMVGGNDDRTGSGQ